MVSALGLTMTRPSFRANWRVEARFGTGLAALMTPRQRANSPAVAIEPLVRSASLISSWFRAAPHESIREALHPRREVAHALRSAQQLAVEPDALEPVVQAEQIREAHAAMHFGGGARHEAADFGGVRLGLRGGERSLGGNRVEGVRRIPDERAAGLQLRRHLGAHVLHRLERADRAAELPALL